MKIVPASCLAFFLASAMLAGFLISSHAATTEKQAVMAAVMEMFDGMSKRDAELIKKPLLTGGSMVLMREGKPVQMTFQEFADRVAKPGTTHIEERIHDPLVRIDHDLAVRSESMIRWCGLIMIWRWCGPRSNLWRMAR
jgi:hypothetical protein